ncbi:MAG: hypothetical protein WBF68_06765, partial [Atribacterota bacterium]
RNIYQVTPLHMVKNTLSKGNIFPHIEEKITLNIGKKLPTNNTNLKHYQGNNNKEGEDAVVAVVNFKKLKEKGEEKMRVIRERMVELDFKEEFIEKILKEYSMKKIEEKLDLLLERKNIQSPAGWLSAALKNDYQDTEQERYDEEPAEQESQPLRIDSRFRGNDIKGSGDDIKGCSDSSERGNLVNPPEWTSREKDLKAIKLIQDNLSACISPIPSRKRSRERKNVRAQFIKPIFLSPLPAEGEG